MSDSIRLPIIDTTVNFPQEINLDEIEGTLDISESLISKYIYQRKNLFAIKIKDNSSTDALMLLDDFVIILKSNREPKNGEFIALYIENQITFRYFFKHKNGYLLRPAHPSAKDMILSRSSKLNLIGKVVLVIRNVIKDSLLIDTEEVTETDNRLVNFHNDIKDSLYQRRLTKVFRVVLSLVMTLVIVLFFLNIFNLRWPDWTGFSQKTLWDWLELLIIPVVISLGVFLLNQSQKLSDQIKTEETSRENTLQQYLDKMTELLADNRSKLSGEEQRHMARTRTLTVLRGLDGERKGIIIRFLHEATLVQGEDDKVVVQLIASDLSYINLSSAYLSEINLNGTNLYYADLQNADLSNALLKNSFLYGANLSKANMADTDLSFANLENADLTDTDFRGANFSGAIVTNKQLKKAKSIDGATLPKGLSLNFNSQEYK